MNNKLSITYLILFIIPFFFACRGSVKEEKKNKATTSKNNAPASSLSLHTGDDRYFVIDQKESVVIWKGAALIGANAHKGFIYISQGELLIENDQLTGGTVEVNMNSIEDEGHGRDNNLVNHLKDPDFFDVKKFPFSSIAITKVVAINGTDKNITGNLTIKGITHVVTFPAKIEIKDGVVKANGKLTIDRTKWDVRYKSQKFADVLANQAISDSIEFDIKIIAKK